MKILIYLILFASILMSISPFSCNSYFKDPTFNLDTITAREIATGKRYDEILLGFKFGMTQSEYSAHRKKCYNDGNLQYDTKNKKSKYILYINDSEKYECFMAPEFHNGKLYKLSLIVESSDFFKHYNLWKLYMEKYDKSKWYHEDNLLNEDMDDHYFIDGNRVISIIPLINIIEVCYTDYMVQNAINQMEKEKEEKLKQKTIIDI